MGPGKDSLPHSIRLANNHKIAYFVPMETYPPEQPPQNDSSLCRNCNTNPIVEGFPNPLCESCRNKFIHFPIPVWVKGFGAGVLILVVIGLISFPKQIITGIHMKRAEAAIAEKRYLTAENELRKVMVAAPEMKNAKSKMLIASFYTMDLPTLVAMVNGLKGVSFEEGSNINTLNGLVADAGNFFPSDSLNRLLSQNPAPPGIQDSFRLYVIQHPYEPYAVSGYVSMFSEKERLSWCDSILHEMLNAAPGYMPGIMAAVSIARMQRRYDSALNYCQQLLSINKEFPYAIASEARISMARGKFSEGIELAKKACALDATDGFSEATLALGYHLNHQSAERDQLIKRTSSDSSISSYMEFVKQVMDGKEKFN